MRRELFNEHPRLIPLPLPPIQRVGPEQLQEEEEEEVFDFHYTSLLCFNEANFQLKSLRIHLPQHIRVRYDRTVVFSATKIHKGVPKKWRPMIEKEMNLIMNYARRLCVDEYHSPNVVIQKYYAQKAHLNKSSQSKSDNNYLKRHLDRVKKDKLRTLSEQTAQMNHRKKVEKKRSRDQARDSKLDALLSSLTLQGKLIDTMDISFIFEVLRDLLDNPGLSATYTLIGSLTATLQLALDLYDKFSVSRIAAYLVIMRGLYAGLEVTPFLRFVKDLVPHILLQSSSKLESIILKLVQAIVYLDFNPGEFSKVTLENLLRVYEKQRFGVERDNSTPIERAIESFINFLTFMYTKGVLYLKTGDFSVFWDSPDTYLDWLSQTESVLSGEYFAERDLIPSEQLPIVLNLLETGHVLLKMVTANNEPSKFLVSGLVFKLGLLQSKINNQIRSAVDRVSPLGIMLFGPPGIGKSSMIEPIHQMMCQIFELPNNVDTKYVRNSTNKYWDGFSGVGVKTVVFDDPDAAKADKSQANPMEEMMSVINTVAYTPPQADLVDKGSNSVDPYLVIATTNFKNLCASELLHSIVPIVRRLPYVIEPIVKEEFRDPEGYRLDETKIPINAVLGTLHVYKVEQVKLSMQISGVPEVKYESLGTHEIEAFGHIEKVMYGHELIQFLHKILSEHKEKINQHKISHLEGRMPYCVEHREFHRCLTEQSREDAVFSIVFVTALGVYSSIFYIIYGYYRYVGWITRNYYILKRNLEYFVKSQIKLRDSILKNKYILGISAFVGLFSVSYYVYRHRNRQVDKDSVQRQSLPSTGPKQFPAGSLLHKIASGKDIWKIDQTRLVLSRENKSIVNEDLISLIVKNFITVRVYATNTKYTFGSGVMLCNNVFVSCDHVLRKQDGSVAVDTKHNLAISSRKWPVTPSQLVPTKYDITYYVGAQFECKNLLPYICSIELLDRSIRKGYIIYSNDGVVTVDPLPRVYVNNGIITYKWAANDSGRSGCPILLYIGDKLSLVGLHRGVLDEEQMCVADPISADFHTVLDAFVPQSLVVLPFDVDPIDERYSEVCTARQFESLELRIVRSFGRLAQPMSMITPRSRCVPTFYASEFPWKPPKSSPNFSSSLVDGIWQSPMRHMMRALDKNRECIVPLDFKEVIHIYALSVNIDKLLDPLSLSAAIVGMDGIEGIDRINMSTGAGYPFNCVKEVLFKDPHGEATPLPILVEEMYRIMVSLSTTNSTHAVFECKPKDEFVSHEKARVHKVRLYFCGSVALNIIMRVYFLPWLLVLRYNSDLSGVLVGVNCYSKDWEQLGTKIQQFSTLLAGDYSSYDKRISYNTFLLPMMLIEKIILVNNLGVWKYCLPIMWRLVYAIGHGIYIYKNEVFSIHGTAPSGHPMTSDWNSVMNQFLLLRAMSMSIGVKMSILWRECYFLLYGDDHIVGTNYQIELVSLASSMESLGHTYTDTSKDVIGAHTNKVSIDTVTFLKRRWKYHPILRYITCPIDFETIQKMTTCIMKSKVLDRDTQHEDLLWNAYVELFLDYDNFIVYKDVFQKVMAKYFPHLTVPTEEDLCDAFCSRTVSSAKLTGSMITDSEIYPDGSETEAATLENNN
jgi:hypothetical protein